MLVYWYNKTNYARESREMRNVQAFGNPESKLDECLPKSSLERIYGYVKKWRAYTDLKSPSGLKFKHLKGLDFDEIISLSSGRGVRRDSMDTFKWALESYSHWIADVGTVIPFNDELKAELAKRITPHQFAEKSKETQGENGTYVLAKNKHHASLRKILTDSNHPDAAEILELWDGHLDDGSETITLNSPLISWKESEGGYSVVQRKDRFEPTIDVFRRWDAKVLNQHVTIVQIKATSCVYASEFEAYIDLDTNPVFLASLGYDFSDNNEIIIDHLQKRMPVVEKYNVHPKNTDLLPASVRQLKFNQGCE